MKQLLRITKTGLSHWVGDGFPVTNLFNYHDHAPLLSPYLMLDYVKPHAFPPGRHRPGVGEHPHRGIETVTLVFQGELEHRDSRGEGGIIGPGGVQWMTAGAGLVHDERHSESFSAQGGILEMMQLWVNLPASKKMTEPRYQSILSEDIPEVSLVEGAGRLRIIAGTFAGIQGKALTHTPIDIWSGAMARDATVCLPLASGRSALILLRKGSIRINANQNVTRGSLAIFEREHEDIEFQAEAGSEFVLLSGAMIDEPIVGYGPFVMNSEDQIIQAIKDYESGLMGRIKA